MERSDIDIATLRSGFGLGVLVVVAIALIVTFAVGVEPIIAIIASIALGLVVGGPIGALFGARVAALKKK